MSALAYADHRRDPAAWASELAISRAAVELYLASDVLDLHVDSFIWHRIGIYDLTRRHGHGLFDARFYSQVDFPRIREAQVSGATWVITTNPLRDASDRAETFVKNVRELRAIFTAHAADFRVVRNVVEYRAARADGVHAAFLGIQGGNALDRDLDALDLIPDDVILRVTLVHLSSSRIGVTSSPMKISGDEGLTDFGRAYVERLNEKKIFVDLAHISRRGFFDAIEVHDRTKPVIVTHTGVSGVHEHWRNLDDAQLRAVGELGGVVGIMYQSSFLGEPLWGGRLSAIVDHLDHVIRVAGEDVPALGSDWDGAITPPRDLPTCLELPRLVEEMQRRGWSDERVQKVLAKNALRTIEALRG